jgi:hypothetical protein
VRDPARVIRRSFSALVAIGTGIMGTAAFLPFATWPCWQCLVIGDQPPVSVASLADGYDRWLVLLVLLSLAAAAMGHLMNIRRGLLAVVCFFAALGAFALAVFDAGQPGRLFQWAVLPADLSQASYWVHPPPTGLGIGFYVFVVGAVIATVGASAMVLDLRRGQGRWTQRDAQSSPPTATFGPSSVRHPS